MSATDTFLWPDAAHEEKVFGKYVTKGEWQFVNVTDGWQIEVHGKIYRSFQDYLVLNHGYQPREGAVISTKRIRKKPKSMTTEADLITPKKSKKKKPIDTQKTNKKKFETKKKLGFNKNEHMLLESDYSGFKSIILGSINRMMNSILNKGGADGSHIKRNVDLFKTAYFTS